MSGNKRHCAGANGGFTLLEMIMVCVIMIIIVGTLTASMGGLLARSTLRSTAARIASLGVYARTRALTAGRQVVLRVDTAGREVLLLEAVPDESESGASESATGGVGDNASLTPLGGRQVGLPDSVEITSLTIDGETATDGDIPFYSTGGAAAAEIGLALRSGRSETKRITVNRVTGRVRVE